MSQFWKAVLQNSIQGVIVAAILSIPVTYIFKEAAEALKPVDPVPIGGIIAYWGSSESLPKGFELCDGEKVTSPESKINNTRKPDLRDRFMKGAPQEHKDVKKVPVYGGVNVTPEQASEAVSLSVDQLPSHTHTVIDPGHRHPNTGDWLFEGGGGGLRYRGSTGTGGVQNNSSIYPLTDIMKTSITIDYSGKDKPHEHKIPAHDNEPAFAEVLFIIRVF